MLSRALPEYYRVLPPADIGDRPNSGGVAASRLTSRKRRALKRRGKGAAVWQYCVRGRDDGSYNLGSRITVSESSGEKTQGQCWSSFTQVPRQRAMSRQGRVLRLCHTRSGDVVVAGVAIESKRRGRRLPIGTSISLARDTRKGKLEKAKDRTCEFPFSILPTKDLTRLRACLLKITLSAGAHLQGDLIAWGRRGLDHQVGRAPIPKIKSLFSMAWLVLGFVMGNILGRGCLFPTGTLGLRYQS